MVHPCVNVSTEVKFDPATCVSICLTVLPSIESSALCSKLSGGLSPSRYLSNIYLTDVTPESLRHFTLRSNLSRITL